MPYRSSHIAREQGREIQILYWCSGLAPGEGRQVLTVIDQALSRATQRRLAEDHEAAISSGRERET